MRFREQNFSLLNKKDIELIVLWAMLMVLSACSSTSSLSPGNPLPGIALQASQQDVLFSWSSKSPLAQQLRPNSRFQLLASYETQYGPVTNEVVAMTTVRAGINGVRLTLQDTTKFTPKGQICLRLSNGYQPIPIRIARINESSSGFYYSEWTSLVNSNNRIKTAEIDVQNARVNVKNFSRPDNNFESYIRENNLNSAGDCESITTTVLPTRPETALPLEQRENATAQQCVLLYRKMAASNYIPSVGDVVSVLIANSVSTQKARQMEADFNQHSPGKLWFQGSALPLDNQVARAWRTEKGGKPSLTIASIAMETYEACKTEVKLRFEESYEDWKMMSRPEIIQQQIKPMQQLCRVRFAKQAKREKELSLHRVRLEEAEANLKDAMSASQSQLSVSKKLTSHACPAEVY